MQELAPLKFADDCTPTDLDLVLHHGVAERHHGAAPSRPATGDALTMRAADGAILTGDDEAEARRLGSGERWSRLRAIAEKHGLDLSKPSARQMGEAWLFAECAHPDSHGWKSFAEAAFILQKQNPTLGPADIARKVRELREDLVDVPRGRRQAGTGEKLSFASRESAEERLSGEVERLASLRRLDANDPTTRGGLMREVMSKDASIGKALYYGGDALELTEDDDTPRRTPLPTSNNEDVVMAFNEAVATELKAQGLEDTYANRTKVGSQVRKKHSHLAPVYGRGRRS